MRWTDILEQKTLLPEDVIEAVGLIEQKSGDDGAAHSMEDDLYERVVKLIADGVIEDVQGCCRELLKTKELDFARWCA